MSLIITERNENYLQYVQSRRRHAASGLPNPTRLEEDIRFIQARDQQVLPHVVLECLLARSMLIKMYQGMCTYMYTCIYSQVISCRHSHGPFSPSVVHTF